jgi:predicted secreted protein
MISGRFILKHLNSILGGLVLALGASASFGQTASPALPTQRVNLSAQASVQVAQDLLTMSLSTSREGSDAQVVQAQLKTAIDSALTLARKEARPGQMDVRTGRFGLSPRYSRDGKINGWQGQAELLLEGQDFVRIGETAGKIGSLSVASANFGLTPAQRQSAQAQAQSQAIALFRQRTREIAKSFELGTYTLGEITLSYDEGSPMFKPLMMGAARAMAADAPVPLEAGQTAVSVTVSGSVQF